MSKQRYTDAASRSLLLARTKAHKQNLEQVWCAHILLGLISEGVVTLKVLEKLQIEPQVFHSAIEGLIPHFDSSPNIGMLPWVPEAARIKDELAPCEMKQLRDDFIGDEHILLAFLKADLSEDLRAMLEAHHFTYDVALAAIKEIRCSDPDFTSKFFLKFSVDEGNHVLEILEKVIRSRQVPREEITTLVQLIRATPRLKSQLGFMLEQLLAEFDIHRPPRATT